MEVANFNMLSAILSELHRKAWISRRRHKRNRWAGPRCCSWVPACQTEVICLYPDGVRHFEKIDRRILSLFADRELHTYLIPVLIPGDVLPRCGFFEFFPHQLMAVATLYGDDRKAFADGGEVRLQSFVVQDRHLTPAACLPAYPMFEAAPAPVDSTVTLPARVYRRETDAHPPIVRLADYSVREFIFVSTECFVRETLAYTKKPAMILAADLVADRALVVAQDDFFPSIKERVQQGNARKHELTADIAGTHVALASFNYHHWHVSTEFAFEADGIVVSGCAGFGPERGLAAMRQAGTLQ